MLREGLRAGQMREGERKVNGLFESLLSQSFDGGNALRTIVRGLLFGRVIREFGDNKIPTLRVAGAVLNPL
jgi:hypothetical protein